jgi:hypothetical protein
VNREVAAWIHIMNKHKISDGARNLQDKLHELLTRLAGTIEHVKNWPEAADASRHVESTSQLIHRIRDIVASLQKVESCVKDDNEFRQTLQRCLIPMDLLELLDFGLNPDCFSRGLLRESMGQLQGLKRRKRALEMLGAAVQKGLDERKKSISSSGHFKRERNDDEERTTTNEDNNEPPPKKQKSE